MVDEPPRKKNQPKASSGLHPQRSWKIPRYAQKYSTFQTNWGEMHKFITKAQIPTFNAATLPQPEDNAPCDDDVTIPHFQSSAKHYASKQRKGVIDEHWERLSLTEHTDADLASPFFLSLRTPIPDGRRGAALFLRGSPPDSVLSFWNAQLNALDTVITAASSTEDSWRALIPPVIQPAAGRIQLASLTHLDFHCGVGASTWIQQFLFGFQMVARPSRIFCYPSKEKEIAKTPEKLERILQTASKRFTDRAAKSGYKNAQTLRGEATQQIEKGWLATSPLPSLDRGKPVHTETLTAEGGFSLRR